MEAVEEAGEAGVVTEEEEGEGAAVEVETEVVGYVEGTNMRHYINDAENPGVEYSDRRIKLR